MTWQLRGALSLAEQAFSLTVDPLHQQCDWHDFGHVQRKANLGLLDHYTWLERIRPWLIGCHFHDVIWPHRDHRVPFQGRVDFDGIMAA